MSQFTCTKCQASQDENDMTKHLSATRHKTVRYDNLNEVLECEECEDTNIHQLGILRFGLSDMLLLCQSCLAKEEKPATQYTLSNGMILKKSPQYFKVRDIECLLCGSTENIYVGNNKSNGTQLLICKECLPKVNNDKFKMTSENDDNFLYEFLGIKEHVVPTKLSGKKRITKKRGKKMGKGLRTLTPAPGKPKPKAAIERDQRREHYFSTQAASKAIKSGETVLAVGADTASSPKPKAVQNNGNLGSKSANKTPKGSNASGKPRSSALSNGRAEERASSKNDSKSSLKLASKPSSKPSPKPTSLPLSKPSLKQSSNTPPKPPLKSQSTRKDNQALPKKPKDFESTSQKSSTSQGSANKAPRKEQKTTKSLPPKQHETPSKNGPYGGTSKKNNEKRSDSKQSEKVRNNGQKKQTNTDKDENKTGVDKINRKTSELVLPADIARYTPSSEPKLVYDSIVSYYQELSYNLFMEEKLSMENSRQSYINQDEMSLEWYADQDKKHKQFKLNVLLSNELLNRFVSKKMQTFKKVPFNVGQTLFLLLGEDIVWYGQIATLDTKSVDKRRRNPQKQAEMVVELYYWNSQPLPFSVDIKWFRILPASVPVSRVFMAMSKIENQKFKKILLGKEPIKQIYFRNYVKFTKPLNDSQKVAIQSVLNNSTTVLQGPPGSGKTSTIYEIILQLLNNLNTYPILVLAASNIAIDNIAEKLFPNHQRSILRILASEKEKEYNRNHPLASICLQHKVYDMLPASMKQVVDDLKGPSSYKVSQNQYKKVLSKQIELSDLLIAQAKVIFTTTVVAGGNQLSSVKKIPVVIMDESTQSSEATTLIPLSLPGVEKIVFVGDQKQLSSFSQVPSLSLSLFERVLFNGTYREPHMLDTQYRMHPLISEFPRKKFYNNLLKDGITEEDRKWEGIPAKPLRFWDTFGDAREQRVRVGFREDKGYTYTNRGEVEYLLKILISFIYEKGVPRKDIGIITPYRGQRDLISSLLVNNSLINPTKEGLHVEVDRDDIFSDDKPVTIHMVSGIMIASVDAFQGREKNFMIMSCVRSNHEGQIGFLRDGRRLNVALTRAKYGMALVGDFECLRKGDTLWRDYCDYLIHNGLVIKGDQFMY